jgi:hypothetical protein
MKKKLDLYLAHNLDRRHEIRILELELEKKYNLNLCNPFYDTNRADIKQIDSGERTRWTLSLDDCQALVKNDLKNIDNRDGLFTIIHEPTIGTSLEIAHAHENGKLVIVVSERYSDHPWIRVYANYRFKTLDEFIQWLKKNGYKRKKEIS